MRADVRFSLIKLLVASATAGLLACSLVVDFDPNGKPCSEDGKCLPGYKCSAEELVCVPEDPPPDGGVDGGVDGGLEELPDAGLPFDLDAGLPEELDLDAGL